MKTKKSHIFIVLGSAMILFVGACSTQTPTPDLTKVSTMIAQTVAVQQTRTEIARPTNTPTPQPTPTPTLPPPTATIAPTSALTATATQPAQPIGGTDGGIWVASTPADQTVQAQGTTFSVNVKLMNTGTSTWTTTYGIRYLRGDIKSSTDTYYMPISVPPGAQIEIKVSLTAPSSTGMLRGDWVIFNSANNPFANFYFEYDIR